MTDRSKATTHAEVCWSWGPAHYECAMREIERLREELSKMRDEPSDETLRLAGIIADKIEDGTLFQAGIFSRRDLADKVRAVVRAARYGAQPAAGAEADRQQCGGGGVIAECWKVLHEAGLDRRHFDGPLPDAIRAALAAQPVAATTAPSDENGGHRLVEPDHETALALADAPRSLRDYVAALRSALTPQGESHVD